MNSDEFCTELSIEEQDWLSLTSSAYQFAIQLAAARRESDGYCFALRNVWLSAIMSQKSPLHKSEESGSHSTPKPPPTQVLM